MRKKNIDNNFKEIIKDMNGLIKLIPNLKNEKFKNFCSLFLDKKLYSLGLIENKNSILKSNLKLCVIKDRKLLNIVLKKNFAKNKSEAKRLIKMGNITFNDKLIKNYQILIDRKSEKKIILNKIN